MKDRPLSITIISWLFVIFGAIALVSGLSTLLGASTAQLVADFKSHWMVHLSRLAQMVGGLFMLRGHNWARWLLVVWMAFHVVISVLHSFTQVAIHVGIFSVILFFLFRRPANAFFAGRV